MSGWSLVAAIAAAPLALVAGLCGLANTGLALLWLSSGKDSPSRLPLIGSAAGVLLMLLAIALPPGWMRTSAVSVGALGVGGETLTFLVEARISARRRARSRANE